MTDSEFEPTIESCRICLDEDENFLSIFDPFEGDKIINLFKELTGEMLYIDSTVSLSVCSTCTATLSLGVTFRRSVLSAEQRIRSLLLEGHTAEPVTDGVLEDGKTNPNQDEESVACEAHDVSDDDMHELYEVYDSEEKPVESEQDKKPCDLDITIVPKSPKQQDPDDSDFSVEFVLMDREEEDGTKKPIVRRRAPPGPKGVKKRRNRKAPNLDIPKDDLERACCMCKFVADSTDALMEHVETHVERSANMDKNRAFPIKAMKETYASCKYCPLCQKFFKLSYQYEKHRQSLYLQRPHVCERCGRGFPNVTVLRAHVMTHDGLKKKNYTKVKGEATEELRCQICRRQCFSLAALKQHAISHAKIAEYPCELCDKKFFSRGNLGIHMRVHLNIRPYKCTYCDKTFIHSTDRNRHVKVHTGERPHKCLICEHSYIKKYDLTLHMQKAHPYDKPYSCSLCNASFIHESEAKRHIELEHD